MAKYKTLKVFQCADMPDNVRAEFWEQTSRYGNVYYIGWSVISETYFCTYANRDVINPICTVVDQWLFANGATLGEKVLIEHSW